MKSATVWVVGLGIAVIVGCSSGSGGGGYGVTNCPNAPTPAACVSCVENSCTSEVSSVNGACAAYYDCVCPTGADGGNCTMSSTCQTAIANAQQQCSACASQCDTSMTVSSGGSGH